jgi:hypothetical protein
MHTNGASTQKMLAKVFRVSGRYFVKERSIPPAEIFYNLDICRRKWDVREGLVYQKDMDISL